MASFTCSSRKPVKIKNSYKETQPGFELTMLNCQINNYVSMLNRTHYRSVIHIEAKNYRCGDSFIPRGKQKTSGEKVLYVQPICTLVHNVCL